MGLDMYAFRHKGDMIQPQEKRDKLDGTPRDLSVCHLVYLSSLVVVSCRPYDEMRTYLNPCFLLVSLLSFDTLILSHVLMQVLNFPPEAEVPQRVGSL